MKHGKHNDASIFDHEENLIRETVSQRAANRAMHERVLLRRLDQCMEDHVQTIQKNGTKTGDALLIPVKGFRHLRFGFGAYE